MSLLEVEGLRVTLPVDGGPRPVLHDVSLTIGEGEARGLVGESGSGKSMTARAIARLLPAGAGVEGRIAFDGDDVSAMGRTALRRYRTDGVAMVFQDPRTAINPVRRVGDFLTESLRTNRGVGGAAAERRAVELLGEVGIADGERRLRQYPHELSGGLLQRVMIASALTAEPRLILADEPTTALDVTTQAEVVGLLDELRRSRGLGLLFITHDLDLAAAICDTTSVMYAGRIVETQPARRLHERPLHPYTAALVHARPELTGDSPRLTAIPGRPLSAFEAPDGCAFAPRCPHAQDVCRAGVPPLAELEQGRTRCVRAQELVGERMETT
jgi:oligopeptide/dipeptide ABC transporter ATP-binding protein